MLLVWFVYGCFATKSYRMCTNKKTCVPERRWYYVCIEQCFPSMMRYESNLGTTFPQRNLTINWLTVPKWRKTDRLRLRSKHWWEHISVTKWYLNVILSPIYATKIWVFISMYHFFAKQAFCAISHLFFKNMLKWDFTVNMCCIAAKYRHLCFFGHINVRKCFKKLRNCVTTYNGKKTYIFCIFCVFSSLHNFASL